ncbi:MAG: SP_1767 family glycosyltransferase [bacterium]|nr:SP_1767 family glycosyltransferase [bacterium]
MSLSIHNLLHFVKQECVLYPYFFFRNSIIRMRTPKVKIMSIEDTIEAVVNQGLSVSRYGDGEFSWMVGIKQKTFQDSSEEMKKRLLEIINSNQKGHIVCLSDAFGSLRQYNHFAKRFWMEFMVKYRKNWIGLLDLNKTYYNTNMTRFYMDYKDKLICKNRFCLIKRVWDARDIIIVEGDKTRLGIGNDLFDNAKSIHRILAPATNAFFKYDDIMEKIKKHSKDKLILMALGPTATIMAYDLHQLGYQAIDVGHIDIEYEWFLMGAKTKVPVPNKYVNEAKQFGGIPKNSFYNEEYINQILDVVEDN